MVVALRLQKEVLFFSLQQVGESVFPLRQGLHQSGTLRVLGVFHLKGVKVSIEQLR